MQEDKKKKNTYDVAVIGGGPAGIIAAGIAAKPGIKVVLIERNSDLARKLLLTGNGRCNLTNFEENLRELVKNYHNGEFLFHAFSVFGPKETVGFFEDLGIKTKIEKDKRVFPKSDDAKEVLQILRKFLENKKIEIIFNSEVLEIKKRGKKITKLILKDREIVAQNYILCAGGKSYPSTGSDGSGYKIAEELGHTIVKPEPALSPIELNESWIKEIQGISLKNISLNVLQNNRKLFSEAGQIMFTHFGISGPAALNISGKVGDLLKNGAVKILIDLFPSINQQEVLNGFVEITQKYPKKTIRNVLSELAPERFIDILLKNSGIGCNKIANSIGKQEQENIAKLLKNIEVTPKEIYGLDQAMVTHGGVSIKEIDHKTLKSKLLSNLSFAGEIMDIDGKTGGFNLQMCWSTGYLAGRNLT